MLDSVSFLIAKDEVLNNLYQQFGIPFIPSRPEGFETLCKLILEQQVSLESARACYIKLQAFVGEIYPESILSHTDEALRNCTISRQKVIYLKSLSQAIVDGRINLESFSLKPEEKIRQELIQIKGIGNWTIDIYLMFSLNFQDIIPLGDIAVKNTIKELYNCHTDEAVRKMSERWMPHRSMATYFLWHYYLIKRNRKPIF